MAVEVTESNGNMVEHTNASYVNVVKGHLFVFDTSGLSRAVIAVYAPDMWRNSVVVAGD